MKDGTACPWAELCWELDEQLPWTRDSSGQGMGMWDLPCRTWGRCSAVVNTSDWCSLRDQLAGPWYKGQHLTLPAWPSYLGSFTTGLPFSLLPLPFHHYFLNFIFIIPHLQPP